MFRREMLGDSEVDARFDNPRILSAATAVPPPRVEQGEIKGFARRLFAGKWSLPERNALYAEHALFRC